MHIQSMRQCLWYSDWCLEHLHSCMAQSHIQNISFACSVYSTILPLILQLSYWFFARRLEMHARLVQMLFRFQSGLLSPGKQVMLLVISICTCACSSGDWIVCWIILKLVYSCMNLPCCSAYGQMCGSLIMYNVTVVVNTQYTDPCLYIYYLLWMAVGMVFSHMSGGYKTLPCAGPKALQRGWLVSYCGPRYLSACMAEIQHSMVDVADVYQPV